MGKDNTIETRYDFYTGKGGVGKASVACATAINLADAGKRVLLVSTDPASNLDDVLQTRVGQSPTPINGVQGLDALNLNPEEAAPGLPRAGSRIIPGYSALERNQVH